MFSKENIEFQAEWWTRRENVKRAISSARPPRLGWKSGLHTYSKLASGKVGWPSRTLWQDLQRPDTIRVAQSLHDWYRDHASCLLHYWLLWSSKESLLSFQDAFIFAKEFLWEKRKNLGLEEGDNGRSVHRTFLSLTCFWSWPLAKVTFLSNNVLISGTGTF